MEDAREKWDAIYRDKTQLPAPATRVLAENLHLLPEGGDALELACGLAGNATLLAQRGFSAHAWDISPVVTARLTEFARANGLPLQAQARDLVASPPQPNSWDVIVVAHFLDRGLFPFITAALRPGGLLFYQTFTRSSVTGTGPKNLDFRLASNELLSLCAGLEVLVYREEGLAGDIRQGLRDEALIVARRSERDQ
ncbi:MAG: methyltransferase domain-containing protein [Gammaproteobacteria bacterium]|jgi:SAM-dependent methyltransferase|nr:methyltransferase domain-containing protein [Gammaproteobacteria bacterium]